MSEMIRFPLMVLASICGILIGASIAQAWTTFRIRWKYRKKRK